MNLISTSDLSAQVYISDPEHTRSFTGRFLWIYRHKGSIKIDYEDILITSGALETTIAWSQVVGLSLGTFPRTAKPIPLRYISIEYEKLGLSQFIYIVPWIEGKSPWLSSVWGFNKNTKAFLNKMKKMMELARE